MILEPSVAIVGLRRISKMFINSSTGNSVAQRFPCRNFLFVVGKHGQVKDYLKNPGNNRKKSRKSIAAENWFLQAGDSEWRVIFFYSPLRFSVLLLYFYSISSAICRPSDCAVGMPPPPPVQESSLGQAVYWAGTLATRPPIHLCFSSPQAPPPPPPPPVGICQNKWIMIISV